MKNSGKLGLALVGKPFTSFRWPAPGTFSGSHPTAQQPDAPLGANDWTGLRVLYPDLADTINVGSLSGRILPANPLSAHIAAGRHGSFRRTCWWLWTRRAARSSEQRSEVGAVPRQVPRNSMEATRLATSRSVTAIRCTRSRSTMPCIPPWSCLLYTSPSPRDTR